jgi:hypothetical protein
MKDKSWKSMSRAKAQRRKGAEKYAKIRAFLRALRAGRARAGK